MLDELYQEICLFITFNEFSKGYFFCTFYDSDKSLKNTYGPEHVRQVLNCYGLSIVDTMPGEKRIYMQIIMLSLIKASSFMEHNLLNLLYENMLS